MTQRSDAAHVLLSTGREGRPSETYARAGAAAPETGVYEQIDLFRLPTGITERLAEGERLPLAPVGYTWRQVAGSK
jgi:hypothetical protein